MYNHNTLISVKGNLLIESTSGFTFDPLIHLAESAAAMRCRPGTRLRGAGRRTCSLSEYLWCLQAASGHPPLSEELLSRHSASMDQLSEAHTGNGISSGHQQAANRSNGERQKADRAGKQIKSYPVAAGHQAGGLFDDDEAVEELMQGLQGLQTGR